MPSAAAAKPSGLSSKFNMHSLGEFFVKSVILGSAIFLLGGVVDFTLFHNHPMGMALINMVNEPLMMAYDWIANTAGLEHLARPDHMLDTAGRACASVIDPITGAPMSCVS